ncbi:MAG: hypothetical protein WKF87_10675 [Chryseolinea sp.]
MQNINVNILSRCCSLTIIAACMATMLLTSAAVAQEAVRVTQPRRYEKLQKGSDEAFQILSLKEKGLALFREMSKYKNSNKLWELIFLDSALQVRKEIEVEIKDRNKFLGYEITPEHLFFLFRTGETTKNDFELIDIDLNGVEVGRYQFKPDLDFKLTHFTKAGDNFIFGGYVNNEPAVVLFELPDNRIRVIPGFFQKDTELVDLRTNQNQTFNTVLIDRGPKDIRKLIFRTFDENGKQLLEDVVPIEEQKFLQTGITSTLEREDLAVVGTWGLRNSKQSIGFYFMPIDPFNEQKIKYVDFGQLGHFLDHLNPKRAERVKANSASDATAGRIPNFTSYVMPYKVMEYKEGFLLLAELYSPELSMSPNYSNPYYYNPYYNYGLYSSPYYYPGMSRMYRPYSYGNNMKTVDEIKANQSVVLSFNAKGDLNWDQSFKIEDVKMPGVDQASDFFVRDNEVFFMYKKASDLKLKSILLKDNKITEATEKIRTPDTEDVIRAEKEFDGGIRQWVGSTFFVWGYHTIRNAGKDDKVRDVFYINKVVVD